MQRPCGGITFELHVPDAPPAPLADRSRYWLVAIAAAYLYLFPYYPRLQSANELPRIYLVKAMVDDGTFAIDRGVAQYGKTSDLSRYADHYYQNKAPGSSLVAAPVYAVVSALFGPPSLAVSMWLCRVVTGILPTLLLIWLLWGYLVRFAPDPATRRLVLFAYAFGSMAFTYSILYYGHQLAAVCIAGAWILGEGVADGTRRTRTMIAVGLLAGMAPLVDYQAAFAGLPLAIYLGLRIRAWRPFALAALAAMPPLALLLFYQHACFGSAFATGYNYSTTFAGDHAAGFLGLTHPTLRAFVGVMLAPDNGFIVLAPWWLLALPGGIILWRRGERALVGTVLAIAVIFIAFVSSLAFWRAGWEVGPRYIVAVQPFLLPLVAATFADWRPRPIAFGIACGLVAIGVVIYTLSAATLPMWPAESAGTTFKNPVFEVMFRLLGDHAVAPNVLRAVGVRGLLGIAPLVVAIAALVGFAMRAAGATLRGLLITVVVAGVGIAGFALAGHDPSAAREASAAYARTLYPAVAQ
jgi:hypothetical protein